MALDVLEQIQEQRCHGNLLQTSEDNTPSSPHQQVDIFLKEAVNSRNRITVLRLEQEIEKFVRHSKELDLLLKPMHSSYERLAAHRIAQHYGLQSMVVSAAFPKVSRILLVKTSESRLPSIRLADIPLESATLDKSPPVPNEKFAIKQRTSRVSDAEGSNWLAGSGRTAPKTMEEREEEYDKARARIFSSGDIASLVDGETGGLDAADPQKAHENSPFPRGTTSPNGEGTSFTGSSNRVAAIFRDREKDMKDPDYDRSYKRYSQPLESGVSAGFPNLHRMYPPVNVYDKYTRLDGPWIPQLQVDQSPYMAPQPFRRPWVDSGYPDQSYVHYSQGQSDVYLQYPRFPSHTGPYNHIKDGLQYSFQHGLQPTTSLGALGR